MEFSATNNARYIAHRVLSMESAWVVGMVSTALSAPISAQEGVTVGVDLTQGRVFVALGMVDINVIVGVE